MTLPVQTVKTNRNRYGCWICGGFSISNNNFDINTPQIMSKWCYLGCCYYAESGDRKKMSPCICSSSPDSRKTCCCIFGNYNWGKDHPSLCCAFPFGMYNFSHNKEQLNLCWICGQYERYKSHVVSEDLVTLHPCGYYTCSDGCSSQTCCFTWGLGCICNQINKVGNTNATCWICSIPPFVVRRGRCCQETKGCCETNTCCCCPQYSKCCIVDTDLPQTTVLTILPIGEIEWYPIVSKPSPTSAPVMTNSPPISAVKYGVAVHTICCNYETDD